MGRLRGLSSHQGAPKDWGHTVANVQETLAADAAGKNRDVPESRATQSPGGAGPAGGARTLALLCSELGCFVQRGLYLHKCANFLKYCAKMLIPAAAGVPGAPVCQPCPGKCRIVTVSSFAPWGGLSQRPGGGLVGVRRCRPWRLEAAAGGGGSRLAEDADGQGPCPPEPAAGPGGPVRDSGCRRWHW